MSSLADLARGLGNVQLSAKPPLIASHTISFEYPVKELLLGGELLRLQQPSLVAKRERPPVDPKAIGVYDTSVSAVLPIQPPNSFAFTANQNSSSGFTAAVDEVASRPGHTTVEAARFTHGDDDHLQYRLRLRAGDGTVTTCIELDEPEWQKLERQEYQVLWIRLLANLVHRRSARSYYHVQNRLYGAYGEQGVEFEEASWAATWNTEPPRSIRKLLWERLVTETTEHADNPRSQVRLVRHPCGHRVMVRKISVLALPADACAMYAWSLLTERLRAGRFALGATQDWQRLSSSSFEDATEFWLPSVALQCALAAALGSFRAPAFICPPELSFFSHSATKSVFDYFEAILRDQYWSKKTTAQGLYTGLLKSTEKALGTGSSGQPLTERSLPPGWVEELTRWLTRTVRLVTDRGCLYRGPKHYGIHKHGDVLFCGMHGMPTPAPESSRAERDGSAEEEVTSMLELTTLMNQSSLEEDPTSLEDARALAEQEGIDLSEPASDEEDFIA